MRDYQFFLDLQAAKNRTRAIPPLDVSPISNVALKVAALSRYTLVDAEKAHHKAAQIALGLVPTETQDVDMFGHTQSQTGNYVIMLSEEQVSAGIMHDKYIDTLPLVRTAYEQVAHLLRSYGVPTALCGKIQYTSDGQSISTLSKENAGLVQGPFTASITFDTPDGLLRRMTYLRNEFATIKADPKIAILDEKRMRRLALESIAIRDKIGALGRYPTPTNTNVTCNLDYVRDDGKDYIYFFGKTQVIGPRDSGVTIATDDADGLSKLIADNFFTIDEKFAQQNCETLAAQGSKITNNLVRLHEDVSATYSVPGKIAMLQKRPDLAPYFLNAAKREFDIVKWRFHPDKYMRAYYDESALAQLELTNGVLDHFKAMLPNITQQHTPSNGLLLKSGQFRAENIE